MEEYFRHFAGSQVLSIKLSESNCSTFCIFHLMKNEVQSYLILIGGSVHSILHLARSYAEVLHDGFFASERPSSSSNATAAAEGEESQRRKFLLVEELEAANVRGFVHDGRCHWSALIRITITSGSRDFVFGDLQFDICIGLWPSQHRYLGSSNVSLYMRFMTDYLRLLQGLRISAAGYTSSRQLFLRVPTNNIGSGTRTEEFLVLDVGETRVCACISTEQEKRNYFRKEGLANFLIQGSTSGELFIESFKTMELEGTRARCPGQTLCVCRPLAAIWRAVIEINLRWGSYRIKIGQIPHSGVVFFSDIRASGLWPGAVPFFHGVV